MTLKDVIMSIDSFGEGAIIFATKPNNHWNIEGAAEVVEHSIFDDDEDIDIPLGMTYFLEVFLAREIIAVFQQHCDNQSPSVAERYHALTYYLEHDTFLPIGE